ncbi:VOC family protein [Saxibacter everestensis]|uniref:VOC family protein n=1 Tax=Saxibacter everestensis TaxID=2909229 RepID=A0ABY8QY36_9MICO|nr:VOC family protein [Brevibacteriaceae bacterium ZFBP1038]
MTYSFQITVDSSQPHELADWWAETLEWEVEPSDEAFISSMVEQGYASEADTMRHNGTLVWKAGSGILPPGEASTAERILFQYVSEPKTVKNRMHLDLRVGPENHARIRAALEARGATFVHDGAQGPYSWVTMQDPQGNEFCLT